MDSTPGRYCRSCGTRLARDNRLGLCTPCQRKQQDLRLHAPDVPDSFWRTDRFRDAFASWHMGRVIAAYRNNPWHGRPLSQEIVAGWVGISQVQLSRIETGKPIKDLDRLHRWARVLRIPARYLWFELPDQRRTSTADEERAAVPGTAPAVTPDLGALLGSLTARRLPLAAG
jgi:transcriptional regulator with XRE-family HTH domain